MKYILQKKEEKVFSYLLDEGGHAVEIHIDHPADGPKLGDVYIGLVQKVAVNINAAFVEILPGMNGYLPFEEIVDPIYTLKGPSRDIQAGDQLVVQISRDAFGDKDVSLTTRIALRGRYTVLTHGGVGLGVSRRIPEEKRSELKDKILSSREFEDIQNRIGPCGIVLRTNASVSLNDGEQGASLRAVLAELSMLEAQMLDIKLKSPYRSVHSNLLKTPPRWLDRVMHLPEESTEAVITDNLSIYRQILSECSDTVSKALSSTGIADHRADEISTIKKISAVFNSKTSSATRAESNIKYRFYTDPQVAMDKLFSLDRELKRALAKKVNLKNGADLVIETTEALHVIDVNSGRVKSSKTKNKEEALLEVNLEAAREACRQIRLRNLSGIIIIDFISLKSADGSKKVMEELRRAAAADPVRMQVVDMTKLGLVEMTRQKIEIPLADCIS